MRLFMVLDLDNAQTLFLFPIILEHQILHHMCTTYTRKLIAQSNANYKLRADVRKRFKTSNVGDYINVRIRLERFPPGTVKKLHARNADPFQILKKLNDNAYVINLV